MAEVSETTSQNTKTDHNTIASTKKSDGDLQTISREITKHYNPKISQIKVLLRNQMHKKFSTEALDSETNMNEAKMFSDLIKTEIKELKLNRYKIIVQTYIGEQKNQGMSLVNKCFWDSQTDHVITEKYSNDVVFVVLVVYLVYVY